MQSFVVSMCSYKMANGGNVSFRKDEVKSVRLVVQDKVKDTEVILKNDSKYVLKGEYGI